MSENKSWFYLTLWRGTPPEFTERVDAKIKKSDSANAFIKTMDTANSEIGKSGSLLSDVSVCLSFDAEIIKRTKVVWHV